jgi:hypothetical protein
VLRNFVRKDARSARNRGARELAIATPEAAAPSSEALLESMQLQRLLGELVVALEEPYRSAILLRYYEGREPARIAESLGVPAGTVRWRVSEGIARLRAALRERTGDDRRWRLVLLPLIAEPTKGKGAIVAMSTNTKVALVVGAVGVTLAGGGLAWRAVGAASSARRLASAAGRPGEEARVAAAPAEPPGEKPRGRPGSRAAARRPGHFGVHRPAPEGRRRGSSPRGPPETARRPPPSGGAWARTTSGRGYALSSRP